MADGEFALDDGPEYALPRADGGEGIKSLFASMHHQPIKLSPANYSVGQAFDEGGKLVPILVVSSSIGFFVFRIEADQCRAIGRALSTVAEAGDLIVPGN